MTPLGEKSDEQTRALTGRILAVGDSGVPLALFALMVPSYLLRGFSHRPSGTRSRGVAVEETDRMLSELAVRGHLEVSLERGRLVYALLERDAPP